MKITAYVDVLSLWCLYAERSLDRVRARFGERVVFDWRLSLIRGENPLGYTKEEGAWFYRRGRYITGETLSDSWMAGKEMGTLDANVAVEAARSLGVTDDRARRAVMDAAMVAGRPVWQPSEAANVIAAATDLEDAAVLQRMQSAEVRARVLATTAEMLALGVDQRPTIVFENTIPDRAILSGVWAYEPMAAIVEAMLSDEERFTEFNKTQPST